MEGGDCVNIAAVGFLWCTERTNHSISDAALPILYRLIEGSSSGNCIVASGLCESSLAGQTLLLFLFYWPAILMRKVYGGGGGVEMAMEPSSTIAHLSGMPLQHQSASRNTKTFCVHTITSNSGVQ